MIDWGLMARGAYDIGSYNTALDYCEKALAENPENVQALIVRGNCMFKRKQWGLARKVFEKAVEIEPLNVIALCNLGYAFMGQGLYEVAIKSFDKALSIDPELEWARENRALAVKAMRKEYMDTGVEAFLNCF